MWRLRSCSTWATHFSIHTAVPSWLGSQGAVEGAISSSFTVEQWEEWLDKNIKWFVQNSWKGYFRIPGHCVHKLKWWLLTEGCKTGGFVIWYWLMGGYGIEMNQEQISPCSPKHPMEPEASMFTMYRLDGARLVVIIIFRRGLIWECH